MLLIDNEDRERAKNKSPSESSSSQKPRCSTKTSSLFDYDADTEMNMSFSNQPVTGHSPIYRHDLVLFPKLLEVCLEFIVANCSR